MPGLLTFLLHVLGRFSPPISCLAARSCARALSLLLALFLPFHSVLKEIVFMAHHLGLTVNFTPISSPDYERWVAEQTKPRFTVTLLTRQLHAQVGSKALLKPS